MPRQTFERELQQLHDRILILGSMVEEAISRSVDCLKRRDHELARQIIAEDSRLNAVRFEIEDQTLTVIATQQPVAGDLRTLAAILEIALELERIGDYAKGIATISLMIGDEPLIKPLVDIPRMATLAQSMMRRALQAFVEHNVELARSIPTEDDEVDALYNQVYRELLTHIIANPRVIEQSNYLLWAAHNLERAADRVVNICERVVFTVTGELTELGSHLQPQVGDVAPH